MAAPRRRRRSAAQRRRDVRQREILAAVGVLLVVLVASWSSIWPYLVGAVVLSGVGALGWWLWSTDRLTRQRDRAWRWDEAVKAGHRTLAKVDAMTGTEFEELVAELCRRDGCTQVRRVGGAGDHGADVVGRLPDGRSMVIQCKRYTTRSAIASRELRDLLGSKVHFEAEVAAFVTTTRFSGPSLAFAVQHNILAIHRDHLGLWNSGTSLESLLALNGAGQGDIRHLARWRKAYGK